MHRIKIYIIFLGVINFLFSCITPYEPDIESKAMNKFVVSGEVSDNNEIQTVYVSKAANVLDPDYMNVTGCYIRIFDDKGNSFEMTEVEPGKYQTHIDKSNLIPGKSFRIDILTSDGVNIESDFDTMQECPEIDSVYYVRKELTQNASGLIINGLQFYIDFDAGKLPSHFFRWEATETWEYHASYPRIWYYDGTVHHIIPPDSSRMVCWSTKTVKNIFTLSTENLTENRYKMFPLHFVDNYSSRLMYGYSLNITQYALSEAAYSYWDQLRINNSEQGDMYQKQPLTTRGNLYNKTNPDEKVLGFFGASSIKSKRIFIKPIDDLDIHQINYCRLETLRYGGLRGIRKTDYPAYLYGSEEVYFLIRLTPACVDCMTQGGTTTKPDFWPN